MIPKNVCSWCIHRILFISIKLYNTCWMQAISLKLFFLNQVIIIWSSFFRNYCYTFTVYKWSIGNCCSFMVLFPFFLACWSSRQHTLCIRVSPLSMGKQWHSWTAALSVVGSVKVSLHWSIIVKGYLTKCDRIVQNQSPSDHFLSNTVSQPISCGRWQHFWWGKRWVATPARE